MNLTPAVKLAALADIRAWTTEYSSEHSEIAEERAQKSGIDAEKWRAAYDWIDDILLKEQRKVENERA